MSINMGPSGEKTQTYKAVELAVEALEQMAVNTSKVKVCLDCKFPFTIKSRNQRYCDNCSSDAARQRRSRKKSKIETKE